VAKRSTLALVVVFVVALGAGPALACGGLLNPRGNINLLKTTTFAGYHDGVEHYVTSFEYAGGGAKFGSIVPLPGIPSKVIKGGDWTLQRLVEEVQPVNQSRVAFATVAESAAKDVDIIEEKHIGALDITVLQGGGDAVGRWAQDEGFDLPPDAPEVFDFYAERSPVFMAARFNVERARSGEQKLGDGTPVHLVIPTPDPWVPLRILGLGRAPEERVEADLFLLTDSAPAMLPQPDSALAAPGIRLERNEAASADLLADLRSDRGMKWLPSTNMHLSYLSIDSPAGALEHDLALDVSGSGTPSPVAAGLAAPPGIPGPTQGLGAAWAWVAAIALGGGILAVANRVASAR